MNKFDKIASKPIGYKGLSYAQKRLIKLDEEKEQLQKSIVRTYKLGKIKYGKNFRKDERFFDSFELIFRWENRIEKINESINRLEEKHNLKLRDAWRVRMSINRHYHGSF
jgi:hypothetical protein